MIDIKALKSRFIDLAIRGKLVPQLDEEPAVDQIGDVPEYPPFEIPEKWKWVYLCNSVTFNPKVSCPVDELVSFLGMKDVCAGFVNKHLSGEIKSWNEVKNGYTKFCNNDVLLAKITPCFQNRKSAIAKNLVSGVGAGSSEFHVFRCENTVEPEFLLYFFKSDFLINYGVSNFTGTAGQQRVGTQVLKNCLFPLPPISEQRRIVARLNEIFAILDKAEDCFLRVQDLGKSLKNKFLQMAIEGKLVPQLDEEPPVTQLGDIPEDPLFETPKKWKTCYLENISESISDGSHNPPPNTGSGIPVLSAKNINQDRIDFSIVDRWTTEDNWKYENKKINIENGDVLLTIVGTIGRIAVVHTTEKFILQRSVCIIKVNKKLIDSDYLTFVIQSTPLIKWMYENASGTAQKGIYLKTVKKLQIPLPPLSEQRRIVTRLNELFALVDKIIGVEAK